MYYYIHVLHVGKGVYLYVYLLVRTECGYNSIILVRVHEYLSFFNYISTTYTILLLMVVLFDEKEPKTAT